MRRLMLGIGAAFLVVVLAVAGWLLLTDSERGLGPMAINVEGSDLGGPFELVDTQGRTVTDRDVIDGPTLVYFGYTFCPDVCPVDAAELAQATDILAERGIDVTPVFITVDPERDTPEQLGWFTEAVHPKMVGLSGTPEQVRAAADAYRVYYAKAETPDSAADYLMSHTNFTYVMTPEGIAGLLQGGAGAEDIANEVERVIGAKG